MLKRKDIQKCINYWRKELNISPKYSIKFDIHDNSNTMPEDFEKLEACIEVDQAYFNAEIDFNGPMINEKNINNVVAHELLHIIIEPLSKFAELGAGKFKDQVRIYTESTIETILSIIEKGKKK